MRTKSFIPILLPVLLLVCAFQLKAQKVGLLMDSYVTDRWFIDQKLFTDKVKELGGEVKVEVAYGDPAEQIRLGKKLLAEGVKVLVIVAVDGHKASEIVEAASAVHVPVIAYDRLIDNNKIAIYISYNNERVGEMQAQAALAKFPQGKYLLVNGPIIDNNAILYRNGQLKVLKKSIDEGKVKIIGDLVQDDWGEIGALMKVDEFVSLNTERPDVIIAANDALASGAIQALPAEMKGKTYVTGQDADLSALRYIVGGLQSMTIYKPIKPVAYWAAESAIKLAKGETVKGTSRFKDGKIEVEAVLLDPVAVDKSNYRDTVVKDGHVSLSELLEKK